jgi:hypothetical protein
MSIFSPRVIHSSSNPTSFSSTASVGPAAFGSGGSSAQDEIYDLFKGIDKAGEVSDEEDNYEERNESMPIFLPKIIRSPSNPASLSSTTSVGPAAFASCGSIDEDEIYDLFKDIDKAGAVSDEEEPSSSLTSTTAVTL